MRQQKPAFDQADTRVLLVAMGTPEQTAAFKQKYDVPYTMISDPEQQLYSAMQIGSMSVASAFSPAIFIKAGAALAKGHGIGRPHGDIRQLPALFIIGTEGKIIFRHYGKDPADHLGPEKILARL